MPRIKFTTVVVLTSSPWASTLHFRKGIYEPKMWDCKKRTNNAPPRCFGFPSNSSFCKMISVKNAFSVMKTRSWFCRTSIQRRVSRKKQIPVLYPGVLCQHQQQKGQDQNLDMKVGLESAYIFAFIDP